jgi:hypothetical protein
MEAPRVAPAKRRRTVHRIGRGGPAWCAAALALLVLAEPGAAARRAPQASSSRGGVSYHPTAAYPHNVMAFRFSPHAGTITVVNASGGPRLGTNYRISVRCAAFVGNGVVYWGGQVTSTDAGSIDEKGRWAFGYFKAGGPGRGRVAGQWAPTGTCYSPAAKALAGPSFPVVTGVITVT